MNNLGTPSLVSTRANVKESARVRASASWKVFFANQGVAAEGIVNIQRGYPENNVSVTYINI